MNEADKGKVVYRGRGIDAFKRFMDALVQRGKTDEPLVVEVHRETAIVPVEPPAAVSAYLIDMQLRQTAPVFHTGPYPAFTSRASETSSYVNRTVGRYAGKTLPQRIGDCLLIAYAMPFVMFDIARETLRKR